MRACTIISSWLPNLNRRATLGSLGSAALRAIAIACNLLAITLVVRLLGPVRYEQFVLITVIAAWLALCALGTPESVTQGVVRARAAGSARAALVLLKSGLVWSLVGAALGLVAGLGALVVLQPSMAGDAYSFIAGLVLLATTALLTPTGLVSSVFVADGQITRDAFFKMLQPVILLALLLACLLFVDAAPGLLLIAACGASALALLIARGFAMRAGFSKQTLAVPLPDGALRSMAATATPFFILQIAAMLAFQTDRIIVNQFSATGELGSYDLLVRIYTAFYTLYSIPLQFIWSSAGRMWAAAQHDRLPAHAKSYLVRGGVFWIGCIVLVSLAGPTAIALISGGTLPVPSLGIAILVGVFFLIRGLTDVLTLTLYATGRQRLTIPWIIGHGLSNVALAWVGGLYAGIPGVVAGQIVSFAFSTLVPFYWMVVHRPAHNPAPDPAHDQAEPLR